MTPAGDEQQRSTCADRASRQPWLKNTPTRSGQAARWVRNCALVGWLSSGCGDAPPGYPSDPVASANGWAAPEPAPPAVAGYECQASDQTFVRRALLATLGRRPLGQGEVEAFATAMAAARARAVPGHPVAERRVVARAMFHDPAFRERWADFFMDALRVARSGTQSQQHCYGTPGSEPPEAGGLAAYVRDHDATANQPPGGAFTMQALLASALDLDDLSVVYRAHLFAMLARPIRGNASELDLELARRNDFGSLFDAAYTNRDLGCLGCHNSELSVTYSSDPESNRFWPVPGLFERALFGRSSGLVPGSESSEQDALLRSRAMFRVLDVVSDTGRAPYGWDSARCGLFQVPDKDDPLGVDAYFGTVRGPRASVWDLERALRRGADLLAQRGLERDPEGVIADADQAFAYLVALNIVEQVWIETMGNPLTIAHHFPRTSVQRDLLVRLTDSFVSAHFSLETLLLDIMTEPLFNLASPSVGCLPGPYSLPRLFDPWTDAEPLLERRGNSLADAVFPISPRPLRKSLHHALAWPPYPEYPSQGSDEEALQAALGFALRSGEPGQRGLDFQGRLAWEATYGSCAPLASEDFISRLASRALTPPRSATLAAIVALKDRLLGSSQVSASERSQLEQFLGFDLDRPAPDDLETSLRSLCGVLVSTPQFQLAPIVAPDTRSVPALSPAEASLAANCDRVEKLLAAAETPIEFECGER